MGEFKVFLSDGAYTRKELENLLNIRDKFILIEKLVNNEVLTKGESFDKIAKVVCK